MQKLHTEAGISELNLPGFQSQATMEQFVAPDTDWQPVLSLSIYSLGADGQINVLTGIRSGDTPTHGNVISTPTGRFPKSFEPAIIAGKQAHLLETPTVQLDELNPRETRTIATFSPNIEAMPDRASPFVFVSHEVVARKLGLTDALQSNKSAVNNLGTLSLGEMIAGFSYAADHPETGEALWEPLIMYAGILLLNKPELIPTGTAAYRNIGWTSLEEFLRGYQLRDARRLVPAMPEFGEVNVCVRGLCLTTTSAVTDRPGLSQHLGLVGTGVASEQIAT